VTVTGSPVDTSVETIVDTTIDVVMPTVARAAGHHRGMTWPRIGAALIAAGIGLIIAGSFGVLGDDLLHIGGVGIIVLGAVTVCIASEDRDEP
jgi:hypothetical protein